MTTDRSAEFLAGLVRELCKLPDETGWVEFKVNYAEPQEVGEYIAALANSAALEGKVFDYLVWGVEDQTHRVVGTQFAPATVKVGNEELENWLLRLLEPKIDFNFREAEVDGQRVVLLEIGRAFRHPVRFQGNEYIRVGSYKKKLKDFPEKERALWRVFDNMPFESLVAAENVDSAEVLRLLNYPAYFELTGRPLPDNKSAILDALKGDDLVCPSDAGGWNVMNHCARP